jgi:hypothetical protein
MRSCFCLLQVTLAGAAGCNSHNYTRHDVCEGLSLLRPEEVGDKWLNTKWPQKIEVILPARLPFDVHCWDSSTILICYPWRMLSCNYGCTSCYSSYSLEILAMTPYLLPHVSTASRIGATEFESFVLYCLFWLTEIPRIIREFPCNISNPLFCTKPR